MDPRITFGMIVLNGEPFTIYNLRSLYPFAHEIIVVEGACPSAKNIATENGHSRDGTLEILRRFQVQEDPDHKLTIVTAEDEGHPDGFWTEKDEMSQAYARRATGNYLWQVDSDEFYKSEDMTRVISMLRHDPGITAVSFRQISFWGGFDYIVDGIYLRGGAEIYHRLFQWGPGYTYVKHRPPTVHDSQGRDLRDLGYVSGYDLEKQGIVMHHCSLLFPKQVTEKCDYYSNVDWTNRRKALEWADDVFFNLRRPYRVHNVYEHPSWLERFEGTHPEQILAMRNDIESGRLGIHLRRTDDIERLLSSPTYRCGRFVLKSASPVYCAMRPFVSRWGGRIHLVLRQPSLAVSKVLTRIRSLPSQRK
ncbi:MAG: glycosyltransferase family 2 protein [Armatimonadetes bacterium]|nr:glycosyltransferase family 2 protein [Armatimonadota bacterium]